MPSDPAHGSDQLWGRIHFRRINYGGANILGANILVYFLVVLVIFENLPVDLRTLSLEVL